MSTPLPLDNPLWQFALAIYPSNQSLLLKLQDERGLNVNEILLAAFINQQKYWQDSDLTQLRHWRSKTIIPLREIRRAHKHTEHYNRLKKLELKLEQIELAHLWQISQNWPDSSDDCLKQFGLIAEGLRCLTPDA